MAGRRPIEIDYVKLQEIITAIEGSEAPPANRSQLWKKVAELYEPKVSHATLMNKAEKNNLNISTPKGKKGNNKGEGPKGTTRRPKKYLKQFVPEIKEKFGRLGEKSVNAMLNGKVRSAIKAFCWDCMGESKKEVALCQAYTCPLWPHRPWKTEGEKKKTFPLPIVETETQSIPEKSETDECGA